jgi:hypothetical protein
MSDLFRAFEQTRGLRERTRENSARLARAYAKHQTTGWGEILLADPIMFGCTFPDPPAVTSGVVVESSTAAGDDEPLVNGRFPRVTVGVWKWVTDVRDHYTGAYLFFVVETMGYQAYGNVYPTTPDPGYTLTHHLLFEGISYKDFNPAKLDY